MEGFLSASELADAARPNWERAVSSRVSLPALAEPSLGSVLTIQRSHLTSLCPSLPRSTRCHQLPRSGPQSLFALPDSEQSLASLP